MKIAFYILLGVHSTIHCFGFLKAFNFVEFDAITQPVSKGEGVLWLISFLLLLATLILNVVGFKYWWIIGISAVVISQFLIFTFWQDAKFGSLFNVYLIMVCIVGLFDYNFSQKVVFERHAILSKSEQDSNQRSISDLPKPIQKWLTNTGVDNSTQIENIFMTQSALLKMKPEQEKWYEAKADQYSVTNPPSFNWAVSLNMNPFVPIRGRDRFEEGKGEMQIMMYSFFPVVNAKDNDKLNEAALQRFLAEIVWFPSAARSSYIEWEEINEKRSKATMSYNNVVGSGIFHFDLEGNFEAFSALRYKDLGQEAVLHEWVIKAKEFRKINNFNVPVKVDVSWKLDNKEWTWLKLEVDDIKYNTRMDDVFNN